MYLATLTGRIPIIPPLLPDHFGKLDTVAPMKFGDVFDIPRLTDKLGFPVVEWHEVKPLSYSVKGAQGASVDEPLGCWSTRAGSKASGGSPAPSNLLGILNLGWCNLALACKNTHSHFDFQTYHTPQCHHISRSVTVRHRTTMCGQYGPWRPLVFPSRASGNSINSAPRPFQYKVAQEQSLSLTTSCCVTTCCTILALWTLFLRRT
jgi:hypothetical protein